MSFDGRAIANFVLDRAGQQGKGLTNLSLQKIVFFCHVWSLLRCGRPLVKHSFEAWEFGPVLQYVYREFKNFGNNVITSRAMRLDPHTGARVVASCDLDAEIVELLNSVIDFYSRLSASVLVDLTHAEGGPWHKVRHGKAFNPGMRIEDSDIVAFYTKLPPPVTSH